MNTLGKFWDTKKYRNITSTSSGLNLTDEYLGKERGGLSGQYVLINELLLAVFSYNNQNYLLIGEKVYELNSDVSVKYYCEQTKEENSWIKIFYKEDLILDIIYKNNQEPFLDYIGGGMDEDWDIANFAWHLAGYINKVRENPKTILFST